MNKKPILVLGGTGRSGRRVADRLRALNLPTRIGSRNTEPRFDWNNQSTWQGALHGVQKVYITFQPDLAFPSASKTIETFVEAAKRSHVEHLVLLSGRGEKEAEACEKVIIASGLKWNILRANWFMQNFSENFLLDSILANMVVLPTMSAKEPFVDVDDIADVAVKILQNGHSDEIYELTGPDLLTFENAVSKIAEVSNRNIMYQEVSMDEYVAMLKIYNIPEDLVWLLKYLFTEVMDGRNESVTNDVEKVLGRKAGSFDSYVLKTNQTGVWKNGN